MKKIRLACGTETIVDDEDFERLSKYRWYILGRRYAATKNRSKNHILMHRALMCCPNGLVVDHINGDGLDNRRCNLRIVTHAENCRNRRAETYGTRKRSNGWVAEVRVRGVYVYLGIHPTKEIASTIASAARDAYDGRAVIHLSTPDAMTTATRLDPEYANAHGGAA